MRGVFSEVRDLANGVAWRNLTATNPWDPTPPTGGWTMDDVIEQSIPTEKVQVSVAAYRGARPINLMSFFICSNIPKNIQIKVGRGYNPSSPSSWAKTMAVPSCNDRRRDRFSVVHFGFPLAAWIPHYANMQNHRGGTVLNFRGNAIGGDACVRAPSRPPYFPPVGRRSWIDLRYEECYGLSTGPEIVHIPDSYVGSYASGVGETLNDFVFFEAPEIPGYVFKGWYTATTAKTYRNRYRESEDTPEEWYDEGAPVVPAVDENDPYWPLYSSSPRQISWNDWMTAHDVSIGCLHGGYPFLSYSDEQNSLDVIPLDADQYDRPVWAAENGVAEAQRYTMYGAKHMVLDSEVMGYAWWRFYFASIRCPGKDPKDGHFFGAVKNDNGKAVGRYARLSDEISNETYRLFSASRLYPDTDIIAEGLVVRYNLLMMKYAKVITVTYSVNTAAGSFNESEDVPTYENTYELAVDTATPSAAITIPHVYCKHDFELVGWFTGYRSLDSDPRKNPAVRKMSTGDRVSADTYIWAWWARTFEVEAKLGVRGMYFENWPKYSNVLLAEWTWKRPGYYSSSGYSDNFSVTLFEGSWCRFYFAMIGDWSYFFGPGHLAYPTVTPTGFRTWNEMLEYGDTGYYVAKDRYGRVLSAASSDYDGVPLQPVELNFTFDATAPTVEYYTYANLPVSMGYGVAAVKYTIDDGAEQTIVPASPAPAPGHEVVVWINDVPAGSTVKVWGTAVDPDTSVNFDGTTKTVIDPSTGTETQVENVQTFVADGTASIVWFRFMLRIGALEVREVAYDSMFLWQEFEANVAVSDASAGALSKHMHRAGFSSEYWADGMCCDSIVLFARQGHGRVETAHGANHAMVPVTAGETYSMALDVSCAAWDEATEDPSTITEVYGSGNYYNTTLHCSARVVFYDENDAIILDGQGNELTYEIERGYVEGEHYGGWSAYRGKTMDFQAPTGATHAQVILIADEGYKVQFHDVRFCTKTIFDNATTVIKSSSTEYRYRKWNVRRSFFTPETFGPNYGSRMNIPSAEWTNNSYAFGGWVTSDNAVIGVDTEIQDANFALHSTWKGAAVALILNTMGGRFYKIENGSEVVDANAFYQRRNVGDTYGELPTPRRNDLCPFEGWWTAATGGTRATSDTVVVAAGSITLYAHWGAKPSDVKHDLFFNAVGGTVGESSREVAEGAEYGYLPKPTKARCQFLGWFTELNGGTQATEYDRMGYYDVTLYAHWSAEAQGSGSKPTGEVPAGAQVVQWGYVRYTIKLVTNGGEVASSYGALKYNGGIAKALPTAAQVTKSGATFGGWYETADFSGSAVTEIPATATGTKTFYARWV